MKKSLHIIFFEDLKVSTIDVSVFQELIQSRLLFLEKKEKEKKEKAFDLEIVFVKKTEHKDYNDDFLPKHSILEAKLILKGVKIKYTDDEELHKIQKERVSDYMKSMKIGVNYDSYTYNFIESQV